MDAGPQPASGAAAAAAAAAGGGVHPGRPEPEAFSHKFSEGTIVVRSKPTNPHAPKLKGDKKEVHVATTEYAMVIVPCTYTKGPTGRVTGKPGKAVRFQRKWEDGEWTHPLVLSNALECYRTSTT